MVKESQNAASAESIPARPIPHQRHPHAIKSLGITLSLWIIKFILPQRNFNDAAQWHPQLPADAFKFAPTKAEKEPPSHAAIVVRRDNCFTFVRISWFRDHKRTIILTVIGCF